MSQLDKKQIQIYIGDVKYKIRNLTFSNGDPVLKTGYTLKEPKVITMTLVEEIYTSTMTILIILYGPSNSHLSDLIERRKVYGGESEPLLSLCFGKLNAADSQINHGFLASIETKITGEIFGDFMGLARASIDEKHKDVGAVLASAALEDLLKRLAIVNELNVADKSLQEIANALKMKGVIKGVQTKLVDAFINLRNNAFHAKWEEYNIEDVKILMNYIEEVLNKHFS